MADSQLAAPQVVGRMRGTSTETDSSGESSQGTLELEHAESIAASPLPTEEDLLLPAERSKPRGARTEVTGNTTNKSGIGPGGEVIAGGTGGPCAFGIAYRACRGSTSFHHGYDLPSGPAFADEDEFEQEMGAEFRVAPVLSTNGGMIAGGSERERTDDFSENRGNSSGDRDTTRRGQKRDMRDENTALPLDPSSTERGEGINGKRQANVTGISTHVGKDVRQYPVMEGDDEQEVEGEEEVERDAEDGGEPKRVAADDLSRNPDGHRGCKEDEQSNRNDQDEDARRALVAREWEVIDQAILLTQTTGKGWRDGQRITQGCFSAINKQLRTAEGAVPMKIGVGGSLQPLSIDEGNRVISTEEVLRYFRSQDHTLYKAVIIPFQPRETRFGLFRRIPTLKFSDGKKLRDEIFIYAQMKYTPDDVVHRRLIQTVFRRLTKEQRACPDVGSHWDTIGFQGTDPCTDLNRSMGIFALLQVLYFLDTQPALAIRLYRLSVVDVTGWPFLCVSIGFTKEALGVLRRGSCYCECNRRKVVMDVVNELHQAQFYAFLELCRTEPALHHALHLSKVRSLIESDSHAMVKAYRVYLTENEVSSAKGFVEKGGSAAVRGLSELSHRGDKADEGHRVQAGGVNDRRKKYISPETARGV